MKVMKAMNLDRMVEWAWIEEICDVLGRRVHLGNSRALTSGYPPSKR